MPLVDPTCAVYRVLVCSNARYMDDDEAYELGSFATIDAAICAARKVVDDYLTSAFTAEITAEELLKSYKRFGEDPFIVGAASESVGFSAWSYAAQRSTALTKRAH